uniref:junctional adhesion molecule 3B-like n=1 Tax=Myxine glutinosa TaxID=7769 RepID=UPI00358FCBF7
CETCWKQLLKHDVDTQNGGFHVLGVKVNSVNLNPVVHEFEPVTLSCHYETGSTTPRIEWKKIVKDDPNFVYVDGKFMGDLLGRADISHLRNYDASVTIRNATRLDTAMYRCEVSALKDSKRLDEVEINLLVQVKPAMPRCEVPASVSTGQSVELHCQESEAFPLADYSWFKDGEKLPREPHTHKKFINSSYHIDEETGSLTFSSIQLFDSGMYHCVARNPAGQAQCLAQSMTVSDLNVGAIVTAVIVVVLLLSLCTIGVWWAHKMGYFKKKSTATRYHFSERSQQSEIYSKPKESPDEGEFRHKSSFVI